MASGDKFVITAKTTYLWEMINLAHFCHIAKDKMLTPSGKTGCLIIIQQMPKTENKGLNTLV